jgi:hypothetical protein
MKYILDTCVISELIKKNPNENLTNWIESIPEKDLFISVITIGEIQKGISKLSDSLKRTKLENWLYQDLRIRFHNRIFNIDEDISIEWGKLSGSSEKNGRKLAVIDTLLAATSKVNHCVLVTRNVVDFENLNCKIFNPWN